MATPNSIPAETLFRALSDRTRLRILCLLRRGELCVCDLVTALDIPQPTASRHLASLKRAGIVAVRKDGHWSHYRLAPAATPIEVLVLGCLEAVAAELPEAVHDTDRLGRIRPSCCP
ncbi:MAG: metalloregulator ArsR/SmtB family transcription factor [Planctomycetaceae bacterium]